jgi:hypothetical protein
VFGQARMRAFSRLIPSLTARGGPQQVIPKRLH